MKLDYTGYNAGMLLNDGYFIHSELHPSQADIAFWSEMEARDEVLAKEIELARYFLKNIKGRADIELLPAEVVQELWKRISRENRRHDFRSKRMFRISVAATIVLLIGLAWYAWIYAPRQDGADYLSMLENKEQAGAHSQNIRLLLPDGEVLSISGKEAGIEYRKDGTLKINELERLDPPGKTNRAKMFNQLIVPEGKRSTVTFHDGTKIWVNSGSNVIYPESFEAGKREIFVRGEAFLDVSPDAGKPFIVKTGKLDVTVLGTQFNISAYETGEYTQVVLVSGKVEVRTPEKDKSLLLPNQMYSYHTVTRENHIMEVDVNDYIVWKDGYYQLKNHQLGVVFQKLAGCYKVDIKWNEKLNELTCSGKLDLKEDLSEVLNSLKKAAPIRIIKNNGNIYIDIDPQARSGE